MIEHPKIGEGVDVELREGMVFSMHPHAITDGASACMYMQDTWCIGADGGEPLSSVPLQPLRRHRAAPPATGPAERWRAVGAARGKGAAEGHRTLADRAFGGAPRRDRRRAPRARRAAADRGAGRRARDERDADPRGAAAPRRRRPRREHPAPRRARDASSRSPTSPRSTRRGSRSSRSRSGAPPERFTDEHAAVADRRLATLERAGRRQLARDVGCPHRVSLRALRSGRLGLADARDPSAVGDEPALPAGGQRARASSRPAAPSTRRSCGPASTTTPTSRARRCTTI